MGWNIKNDMRVNALALRGNTRIFDGNGFPTSGPTGTGVNSRTLVGSDPGSVYIDYNTGQQFINHGTVASPYWYPLGQSRHLQGVSTDFNGAHGRLAGIDAFLAGSVSTIGYDNGVRNFGLGISETTNTDFVPSYPLGGPLLTVGTENQTDFMSALGYGSTTALWAPATTGPMVVEAAFTAVTDILTRSFFLGFCGESVDAMVPPVKGSAVTITFEATGTQGDNTHGLFMDSRLTVANGVFFPSVKANAVASVSTTVAALDTPSTFPAAATYSRWRVEIDGSGNTRAFINKAQVKIGLLGASTSVALMPVFGQANSTTTALLRMAVREFHTWAKRTV